MSTAPESIIIRTDVATARLSWDALYALGEHQAAGAPIPFFAHNASELLGKFLKALDVQLGGTGRMSSSCPD